MISTDWIFWEKQTSCFLHILRYLCSCRENGKKLLKLCFVSKAPNIRTLTNESVMKGVSLKAIVDPSNLVALIMNDLE
jgi:hypothetical protein